MRGYIVRAFLPWLIFLAFANGTVQGLELATLGGLLVLFIFNWHALRSRFLFDWCSVLFFVLVWLLGVALRNAWLVNNSQLLAYLFLSGVSFLSLLLRVPVALQHARRKVPIIFWEHPIFVGMNFWLTTIWGVLFLLAAISNLLFALQLGPQWLLVSAIPVLLVVIGIGFTAFFPDIYRNKVTKSGTVAGLEGLSPVRLVKVGQINLAYRLLGEGPLVLMLPGYRMNMHHWDPDFLNYLSRSYQLILVDYPGVGYSDYQQMSYSAEQLADHLVELLKKEKFQPAAILGFDIGGFVAQAMAQTLEDQRLKLVLINSMASGHQGRYHPQAMSLEVDVVLERLFDEQTATRLQEKMNRIYEGAALEGELSLEMLEQQSRLILQWLDRNSLSKLNNQALILVGNNDKFFPQSNSKELSNLLPKSQLYCVENGAHGIIYQSPREMADLIHAFIETTK